MTDQQLRVSLVLYKMYCRLPLDRDLYEGILKEEGFGESLTGQQMWVSLVLHVIYCRLPINEDLYVGILTEKSFGESLTGPTDACLIDITYHVL